MMGVLEKSSIYLQIFNANPRLRFQKFKLTLYTWTPKIKLKLIEQISNTTYNSKSTIPHRQQTEIWAKKMPKVKKRILKCHSHIIYKTSCFFFMIIESSLKLNYCLGRGGWFIFMGTARQGGQVILCWRHSKLIKGI